MDKVTHLREVRRGYVAEFAGGETLPLSPADLRALPLAEGDAVDLADYRQRLLLRQYPEALNRAVGLLAVRARSRQEIKQRLLERGYLPDTVDMVLFKLEKEGLQDDVAFARAWAENRATRGMGKARLRLELRAKGVESDVADEALDALEEEDIAQQAQALADKLLRRLNDEAPREARRKALNTMQRRGYSYAEANKALKAAIAALGMEDIFREDSQEE